MTTDRRRRRKPRWHRVLAVLLVLVVLGGVWFHWQQTGIYPEELVVSDAKLPSSFAGLRITLVSDMQSAQFGEENETLLELVAAQQPDLIAITGDLVDRYHTDLTMVEPLCTGLAAIAPTYYVTGNHEWALGTAAVKELKKTISACGVTVLSNQYLTLERDGETIVLAGIDDPNGYADQKTLAQLMTEIRSDLGDPYVVLLAHRNDGDLYAQCGVDLTLCGHAHGGIVRLPFTDGLLSTDRTLFPTWTNGLYQLARGQMVVSRGLGNSGSTIRIFNRPHLPVVVLTQE